MTLFGESSSFWTWNNVENVGRHMWAIIGLGSCSSISHLRMRMRVSNGCTLIRARLFWTWTMSIINNRVRLEGWYADKYRAPCTRDSIFLCVDSFHAVHQTSCLRELSGIASGIGIMHRRTPLFGLRGTKSNYTLHKIVKRNVWH